MKKSILLILMFIFSISNLQSQNVVFDLVSETSVNIYNRSGISMRVVVFDGTKNLHDKIIPAYGGSNFNYHSSFKRLNFIQYQFIYDNQSAEVDLRRIERIKKKLEEKQIKEALITTTLDLFTDGTYSSVKDVIQKADMIINGSSAEEWAEALVDIGVQNEINKSFDKNSHRIIASNAYSLLKELNYSKEQVELRNQVKYLMYLRQSNFTKTGFIYETAKPPNQKKYSKYPHISASISYPFEQRFFEDRSGDNSSYSVIKSQQFKNEIPFEIRLNYQHSPLLGVIFEYNRSNLFQNLDNHNIQFLEINNAFRLNSYSLGLNPILFGGLQLGVGATYMEQQNFSIETTTNILQSLAKTNRFGIFIEPRININILPYLKIFGSWRAIYFKDKNLDDTRLGIYYFKAGIAFNLSKKAWDFSNN